MYVFNKHLNLFCLRANLSNDFLNVWCRQIFAKASRLYYNSNIATAIEGTLTAWIGVVMMNWPVWAKFLF